MSGTIEVLDGEALLSFSIGDMLSYSGPGSPGGVAHGFKVLERGLSLLDPSGPLQRREITVRTPFEGPGVRDAVELVTRAATGGRYAVEPSLARPERGPTMERFVFELGYRDRTATLIVCEGVVPDEFIELATTEGLSQEQQVRFAQLKLEVLDRVMGLPADEVYDLVDRS